MTRSTAAFFLCLLFTVGSCGGGGGSTPPPGGGGTGGGGSGGGTPTNSDGTAEIVFPWFSSSAMSQTVTVNGRATDPDGVASVTVNGVASNVEVSKFSGAINATSKSSGLLNTEVTWSAEVPLSSGDNAVVVSVEDDNGGVTESAATANIEYIEVPIWFTLDSDAARLVGLSSTRTNTRFVQNLVEHDYSTEEQTVFGSLEQTSTTTCFRRFEDEFLYLAFDSGDSWNLHSYNLSTGLDSTLTNIPASYLDGGPGFKAGSVRELICGDTHTSAYVLINFVEDTGQWFSKSRIVEIDLSTLSFSTLSETDPAAPDPWLAMYTALDDEHIVTVEDISPLAPLTSVALADGIRTYLTPGLNIGGVLIYPELVNDLVYVATFDGIDRINLVAGTRQNISNVRSDDPLTFAQIRSMGYDPVNNRFVIGDESLDTVIAIDATSGERSDFISRHIGEGVALIAPRELAIAEDGNRAYVFDDGGNATERFFEIDLATGDRQVIGNIGQPFNYLATGLALDEANQRAFLSFRHLVIEVDLLSGVIREATSTDTSVLEQINELVLDAENNRLLIGDSVNDGIYQLDLGTSLVDVLSRAGEAGDGDPFGVLVSFADSDVSTEVFAAGQSSGRLFRVDLETGDRTEYVSSCSLGGSTTFQGLMQIKYNATANELLVLGDQLYSIQLDTNQCSTLPHGRFLHDLQPASEEQILAVSFGALLQYDRQTGETVIISK